MRADRPPRDCYIEVNTGEEPQKAGISPGAADAFIADCRDRLGLPIEGLMCIPPEHEEPALHFALLREIARRNGLAVLSMGMSADFETAIRFGATHVRVGTAIFGARRPLAAAAQITALQGGGEGEAGAHHRGARVSRPEAFPRRVRRHPPAAALDKNSLGQGISLRDAAVRWLR